MNKKALVLVGGNGKMGRELQKFFKKKYQIFVFDKNVNIKNRNHIEIDLDKKFDKKNLKIKKKNFKLTAIVNLLRNNDVTITDPQHYFNFYNYSNFIEKFIAINNLKNCNVLNISSVNIKLISQQNYNYHFSKLNLELLTKYFSVKYLKKNIMFNDLRIGLIKTKNINKIIKKRNLAKVLNLKNMLDYKNLIDFIEKVYIDNKILNGTCLTLDNSLTNIDQIYFKNITKK